MSVMEKHSDTAVGELKSGDHRFPLQSVEVTGQVLGLLYSATITQTFQNDRDTRMEAVYIFPLPPKAAVHGFRLKVGDRLVVGDIQERGQARAAYRQAVRSGHRAALLEEERSDIFTTTVGNIGPGETIEVSFDLSGPLSCFCNTARLRFPLVVGEVYVPGRPLAGDQVGEGTSLDTDTVADASRLTPPRLAPGARNPVRLRLSFSIDPAGLELARVESTCHFARTKQRQDGSYQVSLLPGVERLDRAFVLEITFPENTLQTSLLLDPKKRAFALTVVPPAGSKRATRPRDVVILLDRSGSMEGWLVIAARRATARIIESLTREDRFAVITFAHRTTHFPANQQLLPADSFQKMKAAEFLQTVKADGGTEMLPALRQAWSYFPKGQDQQREQHVILITDGEVADDERLAAACRSDVRLSTVGIGEAAREGLLTRLAAQSGGLYTLIPNQADLDQDLADMHRLWGQPVWCGLSLNGSDEIYRSPQFWDVWQDIPTTFFGRLQKGWGDQPLEVEGWREGGPYAVEVRPTLATTPLVYRAWARARLLDLEDLCAVGDARPHELVQLSVSAQVLCRYTAFVAIDTESKVDRETRLETVVQPVEGVIKPQPAATAFFDAADPFAESASGPGLFSDDGGCDDLFGSDEPVAFSAGAMFDAPPAFEAAQDFALFDLDDAASGRCDDGFDSLFDLPEEESLSYPRSAESLFSDIPPAWEEVPSAQAESMLFDIAPPWEEEPFAQTESRVESLDGEAQVIVSRLYQRMEGDGFAHLERLGSPSAAGVKDCLEQVRWLERELADVIREGAFSTDGGNVLRQILSALIDYREALEAALDSDSPDLGPASVARAALVTLLVTFQ